MHRITHTQQVDAPLKETWDFFSNPANLAKLMPDDMHFRVLDDSPDEMYEGLVMRYQVAPIAGIKLPWTSKITDIKELKYFIDEQMEGPFRHWHHQHKFEEVDGGTLISDILHLKLPMGAVGKLFYPLIVRKRVDYIFDVRRKKVASILDAQNN